MDESEKAFNAAREEIPSEQIPGGAPAATPGVTRSARGLIGWMVPEHGLRLLNGNDGSAQPTPEQLHLIAEARQAVARRAAGIDQGGAVEDAPGLSAHETLLRQDPSANAYFNEGWRVAMADLSRICAMQPVVFVDTADDRVREVDSADPLSIAAITLPTSVPQQLPLQYEASATAFTVMSRNPNLRIVGQYVGPTMNAPTGPPVIGFFVALAPSYMQVAEFQGRLFLRDGYHRALGLLRRGITRVPVFARTISTFEELVPRPQAMLPQAAFLGDRPPVLADYLDVVVSAPTTLAANQKVIVVQATELNPLG